MLPPATRKGSRTPPAFKGLTLALVNAGAGAERLQKGGQDRSILIWRYATIRMHEVMTCLVA
jgi:hypothetical protein